MGLDWNPLDKPVPGTEAEFEELLRFLTSERKWGRKKRLARFQEISISAYETLEAPQVGSSPEADQWARELYESEQRDQPWESWFESIRGYYVIDLVPPCDGVPLYSNGGIASYVERFSFRAQFLMDCGAILSEPLLDAAYETKPAPATVSYGEALLAAAQQFSQSAGVDIPTEAPDDPDSPPFHLHATVAAARWCTFWGERGHGLEAYY